MSNPFSAWKARRRLRRTLRWLEPELIGGEWSLHGSVAVLPADADGGPDDYQQRMIASIDGPEDGRLSSGKERLQGGTDACCDVLVARGDWTLLMDRGRRWMLRVTDDAKRAERLVRNARWLAQSYPCPVIESADTRVEGAHAVRESFAEGVPIRDASERQWDPAFRQLLLACRRHVAHCQGGFDFDTAWEELQRWRLPAWLERALAGHKSGIEQVLRDCPLLDVHGDCHNGNVFVRPDGGVLLIDLERVQSLPFFYDALSLLRGTAEVNAALRRAYLEGAYDAPLAELWAAAGRTWDPAGRTAALLAMPVAHAFRPQFARADTGKRRDKFMGACDKLRADCGLE